MTDTRYNLEALYTRWAPLIHRRILKFYPVQEAEDVLHEVFLRLHDQLHTFRGESSPSTWLFRLTTNHCLNRLRNEKRRRELLAQESPVWSARVLEPSSEAQVFLDQLWQLLPDELCTVGIYYFVDGLTHAEIASILGVSRRTIGNRIAELQKRAQEASS